MMVKPTIDSILGQPEPTPIEIKLIPAYGRSYKSKKEAEAHWNAGKDFKIFGGPYCSIRDMNHLRMIGDSITFCSYDGKKLSE